MSTSVAVIAGCAVTTFAIKAAGPVALGGRDLPGWFTNVIILLAPALFTGEPHAIRLDGGILHRSPRSTRSRRPRSGAVGSLGPKVGVPERQPGAGAVAYTR